MDFNDVDYWEINEAFAAQFLGVGVKLKEEHGWTVDMDKTNANGSGISLGHPIGCAQKTARRETRPTERS